MKKTKLTRSLMAAVSVVALSAVMYGCVHSGGDDAPAAMDPPPMDTDGDGVADDDDAFPMDAMESVDTDGDGIGNNADPDDDNDGVADADDGLPLNPMETVDTDGDGIGNNADLDDDGDGVVDTADSFPLNAMESADGDGDGVGDNADISPGVVDRDNDGVADADDAFPDDAMESADLDMDGVGDNTDPDIDGDGVANAMDAFPRDATETADLDMDGVGDNADSDIDGDGVANAMDAFPRDATETADLDMDGVGDNTDTDIDGDGVANGDDAFPRDAMESADLDMDGVGDNADPDIDGDGVANADDALPRNAMESADLDGDGVGDNADTDVDGDGVANAMDAFPRDAMESADLDMDGVGDNADPDIDGDGIANADDVFPRDNTEAADLDGDGVGDGADPDRDGDGVPNVADVFPNDPDETVDADGDGVGDNADPFDDDDTEWADEDGDGIGDNADPYIVADDRDNDGVADADDAFPDDPMETMDSDGDMVGDVADDFPNDPDETVDSDGDGVGDNADPFSDGEPSLLKAATGAHVMDLESTMNVDEKAAHVASVGTAIAGAAVATAGNQAGANTEASASWPGDVAANPDGTPATAAVPGMLSISVDPAGAAAIPFELGATREADATADPPITARIQTAMEIDGLGVFRGFDIWEDDGNDPADDSNDFHTDDGARVIAFTNKTQDDPPAAQANAVMARSVVGETVDTASELSNVTSTARTITGVTWTPSGEGPLMGTLTCGDSCSITLGADGAVTAISGYTFTGSREAKEAVEAADAAAQAAANNDYLVFGLWLDESNDGDTDTFGAFADGGVGYDANVLDAITGTASYSGKAAGAHHKTGEGVSWFEGDAGLTANFGAAADTGQAATGTISGSISNIQVNGGAAMSTPIYLGQADLTSNSATFNGAAFMGAPTAPGASTHEFDGTWSGSFYGASEAVEDDQATPADETIAAGALAPAAAAGTFGVTKSMGTGDDMVVESFVGAFGAHKD